MKGCAIWILAAAAAIGGCRSPASPTLTTGLTGVVMRGPVTPVCRIDVPCSAPFSAGFTVELDGRRAGAFRSDVEGRFTVYLSPGSYRVIPDADAPIIVPAAQTKMVAVGANGLTAVTLMFDTGIR